MATRRQIEANRRNWAKRGPITEAGRERLRESALRNQPWEHSTGPRTTLGKLRSRANASWLGEHARVIEPWAIITGLDKGSMHLATAWSRTFALCDLPPTATGDDVARLVGELLDSDRASERLEAIGLAVLLDELQLRVLKDCLKTIKSN
ncbi:MAG: hypothetical protein ACYSVY_24245 [Planctomycetota bacterium]|jgi:hypothetical protein